MGLGYGFNGRRNVSLSTQVWNALRKVNFDLCIACQHIPQRNPYLTMSYLTAK